MMPRYHIHFMSVSSDKERPNRHTRQVDVEVPIEYDTDIVAIQEWAAKEVGAEEATLLSWQELKGAVRPS
jgi:hypothetical protein